MKRIQLASMLCAFATLASAQQVPQPPRPDFSPLEFLVGHCWLGTFPDGKQTDEHCFEWVYDRHFIRDRHVVRGGPPYEGETIYRWDAATQKIAYWYWSTGGMVVTGTLEPSSEGLVFPSRFDTPKGSVELKAVWTRLGDDRYRVSQSQRAGGESEFKPLWTMEMKRQR